MIYITGDLHGGIDISKLNAKNFPQQKLLDKDDFVIVTGDFGLVFDNSKEELFWRNWLLEKNFTTIFVDGNHECISKDTDILTENGWMNIEKVYNNKYKIANFDINSREIFFDYPILKHKVFKDNAIIIDGKNTKQIVSENHDIIINGNKIKAKDILHKKIQEKEFILKGIYKNNIGIEIEDNYIRLLTWVIMDGTIIDYSKYNINSKKCTIQFKLSLEDKIEKLTILLDEMEIPYTIKPITMKDINYKQQYLIRIYSDYARNILRILTTKKEIPNNWRNFNERQLYIFLETLINTDGEILSCGNNPIVWRSINKNNLDIIMEACVKNDIYCVYKKFENMSGFVKDKDQYICRMYKNKELNNYVEINKINYNDYMYCFTMLHGTLITKNQGKVAFTGNCFPLLNQFPVEEWNGGKVHFINDSVIHLMRGQVFTIDDLKFFTMGGATSIDKYRRKKGISWWKEEIPSNKEFEEAFNNLDKHNWIVDYVISHTCSMRIMQERGYIKENNALNKFFDMLEGDLEYKHWYFGHFHNSIGIDEKHTMVYNEIIELKDGEI